MERDKPLVEVTITKCPTRAGFEITLEANRSRFLFECEVGFELPRTVLRSMRVYVGLMLAQALPQIVGVANVEMTGHRDGFENVDVVHVRFVRLRAAEAALRRDAFALWVNFVDRRIHKRALPRCSPRGTSGRKRVKGIEPSY